MHNRSLGYTQRIFFQILIKSTRNQIVFNIFLLIWIQTEVRLDPNQSENGKYNLISRRFNKIQKITLCVCYKCSIVHWVTQYMRMVEKPLQHSRWMSFQLRPKYRVLLHMTCQWERRWQQFKCPWSERSKMTCQWETRWHEAEAFQNDVPMRDSLATVQMSLKEKRSKMTCQWERCWQQFQYPCSISVPKWSVKDLCMGWDVIHFSQ